MRPVSGDDLPRVLVIGGGELGSAVAHRLVRAGMTVFVADIERPTCVRRTVCFASALETGRHEMEGVAGVKAASIEEALEVGDKSAGEGRGKGLVPVIALRQDQRDHRGLAEGLAAQVVVDARMLKRNQGLSKNAAPLVIGLGPGFTAPRDVHAVIETNRGHNLGRVIYDGEPEPDTGVPAKIDGYGEERVIRAPADGVFGAGLAIGRSVARGETVGRIGDGAEAKASIAGLLRGLVADGTRVRQGQKIGDVDPRGTSVDVSTISDKGRAVAGGVLEAIMNWWVGSRARV